MAVRFGIWDSPAVDFLISGLAGSGLDLEPVTVEPVNCLFALQSGEVDLALVPTLDVIIRSEGVEVLPAVALSSWHYPFARIHLPSDLAHAPERVLHEPDRTQEALIARVVLKEHYAMEPDFVGAAPEEISASREARILVGRDVPGLHEEGLLLDLGEEWFEMAAYPMVWGVFVVRAGEASQELVDRLRLMVERSEALREQWAESKNQDESIRHFFSDDVRLRFDDLAVASITELIDHAFYHDLTDEIRDFPIARLDQEADETDD